MTQLTYLLCSQSNAGSDTKLKDPGRDKVLPGWGYHMPQGAVIDGMVNSSLRNERPVSNRLSLSRP
jgi:hypothetical protein